MSLIALLSNPQSTGNRSLLPEVRNYVASTPNIFHVELHDVGEIPEALKLIARVNPRVLVINGGDGTVQATLTEIYHGKAFGDNPPPVAVLANGKTNLIANDLGSSGKPFKVLDRILQIAQGDVKPHIVKRSLVSLVDGKRKTPVIGMFLGAAGLLDAMLFCRNRIYPLGLPNHFSHVLASLAVIFGVIVGGRSRLSPFKGEPLRVTISGDGVMEGRFFLLLVTTLQKLLMGARTSAKGNNEELKLICIEQKRSSVWHAALGLLLKRFEKVEDSGFHLCQGSEIRIEGQNPAVLMDGELFEAAPGRPIILNATSPQAFLSLAA